MPIDPPDIEDGMAPFPVPSYPTSTTTPTSSRNSRVVRSRSDGRPDVTSSSSTITSRQLATQVAPIGAGGSEAASNDAPSLEIATDDDDIDDDDGGPPRPPSIVSEDGPAPSKFDVEPAIAMETTATVDGDDHPPTTVPSNSGRTIEDVIEDSERDSIVVPPSVMIEDEGGRRRRSSPRSSADPSGANRGGNRGSADDDVPRGAVNHHDRGNDSTYRVPIASLMMDRDSGDVIIATQLEPWWELRRPRLILFAAFALVATAIAVGAAALVRLKSNDNASAASNEATSTAAASSSVSYPPTLVQIREEGVLRCGVPAQKRGWSELNQVKGEKEGISVDFCKAMAAAVLGPEGNFELIDVTAETRFVALANRGIDLLIFGDTHTMERDFHEVTTGTGFQFTDPYLYDWLGFAGLPLAVQCADEFNWSDECSNLKICVRSGSTHEDILRKLFPPMTIIKKDESNLIQGLNDSDCNVIAGEQSDISEVLVRAIGYKGKFSTGVKQLSKEPLAFVTRKDDQSWTDVVNWVLRFLIRAEMTNLTQSIVDELSSLDKVFTNDIDFISALRAAGNYGEIYSRNLEKFVPRTAFNLLHSFSDQNRTGLHYTPPTGSIDVSHHTFAPDGKINAILKRGRLICGVIGNERQSMETDYCNALSASLFSGEKKVDIIKVSNESELDMMNILDSGEVDLIAGVSVRYRSDIITSNESASGLSGLALSQPYFYGEINHDFSQFR
ncbi:hypothetical protein ACHAXA_003237 [Cyclostephanos tholiformis]|uniref:Solute-binding protein family 3/N-terminal domain-containing protein n=1 Tax=Cyclostephanos tholiformis TaxID=382380 RepID=A0ABD3R6A7_9STRA